MNLKIVPTPEFSKSVKSLSKKYRRIFEDLKKLKKLLLKNPRAGTDLGHNCYKIRVANSSIPTGKSGGFRVLTYYNDPNGVIRLLTIYSKRDQEDIPEKELSEIIANNLSIEGL